MPMFYTTKIIKRLCLPNTNLHDIKNETTKKYTTKMLNDYGLCLYTDPQSLKILNSETKNYKIFYEIEFNAIFYKFFEDEIVEGIVYFQNNKSILIQTPLLKNIICIPEDGMFFVESGFDGDTHLDVIGDNDLLNDSTGGWYWIYDSHKLLVRNQDVVRCRVIRMEFEPCRVLVAMNDVGLGPVNWWL